MQIDVAAQITAQHHDELKPIVSQILREKATPTGTVTTTKIGKSVGSATAGIFQVTGQAKTQNKARSWSAIVKVLGTPANPTPTLEEDPYRELEVYRSGVLAEVCGGVRAATCYTIQQFDDLHLLWLEDLSDMPQPPWVSDQFIATAHHLGQFNAHWQGEALPQWDWLSKRGFRAGFTADEHFQKVFERFPAQQDHPLMRVFAPPASAQRLLQVWEKSDGLLIQAEGTDRGICHLDCHSRNLFPIDGSSGDSYTIGIDWVKVGVANLGIDIGHLLASSMSWLETSPDKAKALRDPIFEAYVSGLAASGWSGNKEAVRMTYLIRLACEAIRQTNLISNSIENSRWYELMERSFNLSMTSICARYNANLDFYFDCVDEAAQLGKRMES